MCIVVVAMVPATAAAPPKFGLCGGHINECGLWFTRKHPRPLANTLTNESCACGMFLGLLGSVDIPPPQPPPRIWLINGNNYIVRYIPNEMFDSIVSSLYI